jgi:hypothetical protein
MYINHSKYRNTGILFEILVKKITSDTLSGRDSKTLNIIKRFFINTELGKEYKLYETLLKNQHVSESKANIILGTVLEASKKLNRSNLRKEKYNLIKELKNNYNIEDLFKTKVTNYKTLASFYTLFEIYNSEKTIAPQQIIDNKIIVLEYLTQESIDVHNVNNQVLEEFKTYDKDLRVLTYHVLLEKFNTTYKDLNTKQKRILKEYIEALDNTPQLRDFYNQEILEIKSTLLEQIKKIQDPIIKIKLKEIYKTIKEIDKRSNITNNHLVDLLQFQSLIEEITKTL